MKTGRPLIVILLLIGLIFVFGMVTQADKLPINKTEGDAIHITQIRHSVYNPAGPLSSGNCGPASFAICLRALGYLGYGTIQGEWTSEEQIHHARALMYPYRQWNSNSGKWVYTTQITRNRTPYSVLENDSEFTDCINAANAIQPLGGSYLNISNQTGLDKALRNGMPVILFGYLDSDWRNQFSPPGHWGGICGHYIAVTGKTNDGFYLVNDPMYQYGAAQMTYDQLARFPQSGTGVSGYALHWRTPAPAIIRRKTNNLVSVFMRNLSNNFVYVCSQSAPNGNFNGWQAVNSIPVSGNPVVVEQQNGRLLLFVLGASKQILMFGENTDGSLSLVTDFGGESYYDPVVSKNNDERVEFFARGVDGKIYKRYQLTVNGDFSEWCEVGGDIRSSDTRSGPAVTQTSDGRQELFAAWNSGTTNTGLGHIWQTATNGPWANSWVDLEGHMKGKPIAFRSGEDSGGGDGYLYTFVRSAVNNSIYYKTQLDGWRNYGLVYSTEFMSFGQPGVGMMTYWDSAYQAYYSDLCVFVRGVNNKTYWSCLQKRGAGYNWTRWLEDDPNGIITSDPAISRFADGRLFMVVRGIQGGLFYRVQAGSSAAWTSWTQLGTLNQF